MHNKPKLLIHIGYHKTASSFWQRRVFQSNGLNLLDRKEAQEVLLALSPYEFKAEKFDKWLESRLVSDKLNVLSDEEFSGNIHTAGNGRSITYETIERISGIEVADVYVLVFIRDQIDMIDSCYRQYVKKGGTTSFINYINPEKKGRLRHRFPGFSLSHFKYDDVIEHCLSRFDKNHVIAFSYEQFKNNPDVIISRLSRTFETDFPINETENVVIVNKSLSNVAVSLARISNTFFSADPISNRTMVPIPWLAKAFVKLWLLIDTLFPRSLFRTSYVSNDRKNELARYYEFSNARTRELTGIDVMSSD